MMKTEQDARRLGIVAAVVLLLLGFVGCVRTIESETRVVVPPPDPLADVVESAAPVDESPAESPQAAVVASPTTPLEDDLRSHEILLTDLDGERAVVVRLSRPADDIRHFTLQSPERVVVDLAGPLAPGIRSRAHRPGDQGGTRSRP
jgi:hypothetical protein